MSDSYQKLRSLLDDQYQWPCVYIFKFIVRPGDVEKVLEIICGEENLQKNSRTGKYTSVTVKKRITSTQEVIDIYKDVSVIEGVISL